MAKLPKIAPAQVTGAWKWWNTLKGLSTADLVKEAERPFSLALVGTEDHTNLLAARLALETPVPRDSAQGPPNIRPYLSVHADAHTVPPGSIVLQSDPLTADEGRLAETLARIVLDYPDLRLSLARHVPAFRPAAVAQIISDSARQNGKVAVLSALPGVIPFTDMLLPATALGDMLLLTRNQGMLLLQVAAAYGLPIDLRARVTELLPVVGGAFGWRALARELVGLVPGGIGVVVKGSIAYAGTYTVGKSAAIYYSTGQTLDQARMRRLYQDALKEGAARIRKFVRREKPETPASETIPVNSAVDKGSQVGV